MTRLSVFGPSSLAGLFIVLFSTGWIAGKIGLLSAGPLTLLLIRFGAAALVLLAVAVLTGAPWPRRLSDYGHLAVVGLLMHGMAMAGVYIGLSLGVSAGASALIGGMAPIFTALAAGPLLDERVGPAQWSGLAIGLIGVALVVANRISFASGGWEGYAVTFFAVATFVLGTVYQKKFCGATDLRTGNLVQFAVAAAAVLVPALRFEGLEAEWDEALIASSAVAVAGQFHRRDQPLLHPAPAGGGEPGRGPVLPRAADHRRDGLRRIPRNPQPDRRRRLRADGRRRVSRVQDERAPRLGEER